MSAQPQRFTEPYVPVITRSYSNTRTEAQEKQPPTLDDDTNASLRHHTASTFQPLPPLAHRKCKSVTNAKTLDVETQVQQAGLQIANKYEHRLVDSTGSRPMGWPDEQY